MIAGQPRELSSSTKVSGNKQTRVTVVIIRLLLGLQMLNYNILDCSDWSGNSK